MALQPEPEAAGAALPDPGSRRRRRWLPWVLGVLLGVVLIALALQAREARQLAAEREALRAELAGARQELSAYRQHLEDVRGAVRGVRSELSTLEALVERDPSAAAAEAPLR